MRSLASVVLLLILSATLCAQLPTATDNGTVTDPQGAAVVGARIIVTNKATGVSRETTSGADGRYALPGLAPGDYVERVSAAGFASSGIRASSGVRLPLRVLHATPDGRTTKRRAARVGPWPPALLRAARYGNKFDTCRSVAPGATVQGSVKVGLRARGGDASPHSA